MQRFLKSRKIWQYVGSSPCAILGEPSFTEQGTRRRRATGAILVSWEVTSPTIKYLPSSILGEMVPNGHLGTQFAEIASFAGRCTRRSGAKWSPV